MSVFVKTKEAIREFYAIAQDIPLFFFNGKKYFEKIQNEDFVTNTYRIIVYVAFSIVFNNFIMSENPKFDFVLINDVKNIVLQLPILLISYFIALLLFSNVANKIKVCLNYVVFQHMLTKLIPTFGLAIFLHTENYFYYFIYAFTLIVFIVFLVGKFVIIFFNGKRKQTFAGIVVVLSMLVIGLASAQFDSNVKQFYVPFEDPIASEFFNLNCLSETQMASDLMIALSDKNEEILSVSQSIIDYFTNDPEEHEIDFFLALNRNKQLMQVWKLNKEKEYQKANQAIAQLETKLTKSRFQKNKDIINGNIKTYYRYKELLDEYEKTLNIINELDYNETSKLRRYTASNSKETVVKGVELAKELIISKDTLDILKLGITNKQLITESIKEQTKVSEQVGEYLKWVSNLNNKLFFYYHKME